MVKEKKDSSKILIVISILLLIGVIINSYLVSSLSDNFSTHKASGLAYSKDISKIDLTTIKSTAASVAVLFPVDKIKTTQDAVDLMLASGTPEYGAALGVTYDDPVSALNKLSRETYPQIKSELKQNPELWNRYINLATKPVGISCEFCCGIGSVGISSNGELKCGCSHNPAIQALTMWMIKNTDYSDAEILREDLRWKSIWFPKNMIEIATKVSGGNVDLNNLPGMVGGC